MLTAAPAHADDVFDAQLLLAKQGDADAQFRIGEMYENGIGVDRDIREAIYWTRRAANQKHEAAGFKLLYWDLDKKGINRKNRDRLEALNRKAKLGDPEAQYYLGRMYAYGVGVKKNTAVATDWLGKAASGGVLEAEILLAALNEGKPIDMHRKGFVSDPCSGPAAKFLSTCK